MTWLERADLPCCQPTGELAAMADRADEAAARLRERRAERPSGVAAPVVVHLELDLRLPGWLTGALQPVRSWLNRWS